MTSDDFAFWSAEINSQTPKLDVHGLSVASALHEVDFFIDRTQMSSFEICKIIHGAGTGALKSAISKFLKGDSRVISFRDSGVSGESGAVLYAKLK